MKMLRYTSAIVLPLLFAGTTLSAQESPTKTGEPPVETRKLVVRKADRTDSIRREARIFVKSHRVDSVKQVRGVRIKQNRVDSVGYKRAIGIRKLKRDSLGHQSPGKNIRLKKIMVSLPCHPDAIVSLQNILHKVNIIATDDNKVTLVARVLYQGQSALTDSEWFAKLNVSLSGDEEKIEVRSEELPGNTGPDGQKLDSVSDGVPVFDSLGRVVGARSDANWNFLLYVPKGAEVKIDSKYADITLENNMRKVEATILSGVLTLADVDQFFSTGNYARIYAGKIGQADVGLVNGKLRATAIDTLRISSSNSVIGLTKVSRLYINNSQADQYTIEEAQHISGKKAFGSLQLASLAGSVDLSGKNADVNIRHIRPSATAVTIRTQYASLLLPTAHLKSYTVAYEGRGGTVRAPFAKNTVNRNSFQASVGSGYEKLTAFRLNCQDCTVDFN